MKDAFYEAVVAAVQSLPAANVVPSKQYSTTKVAQLLAASNFEIAADRALSTNIVYLQIMLLMAIGASGPRSKEVTGLASPSSWLSSAVMLAFAMKLHVCEYTREPDADTESEEKLSRRLWCSLIIVDRWHSSSSAAPLLIPDKIATLYAKDLAVLRDTVYHLTRKFQGLSA